MVLTPFMRTTTPRVSLPAPARGAARALLAGAALATLAACVPQNNNFDWDLRRGAYSTADEVRQLTAAAPVPDQNGIVSYPGYQMAAARRGESVQALALRLNVNPNELAQANALQTGDVLRQGELLVLPARVSATPQPSYVVRDSAPSTADPQTDFAAGANTALARVETQSLPPVTTQSLAPATYPQANTAAPAQNSSTLHSVAAPQARPTTTAAPTSAPRLTQPSRHVVARGETASTIAARYNIPTRSLAEWNNLPADMTVRLGQTLIIPIATAPAPKPANSAPGQGSATPIPPSAAKPLPNETTEPVAQKPKATPSSPDMGATRTSATAAALAMPVAGSVIRAYDKKSNQGVNLGAPAGSPVKSAEAGTIAAITRDTDQVQIVVIRHPNGLMTVYAGVDQLKVKKGDSVKRGEQIGVLRNANPSFLHFEVRKGVDSLDPMPYLQ